MRISYNKLQKLMIDNQMKRQDLMRAAEISSSVATKLNKNEIVSLEVLMKICQVFHWEKWRGIPGGDIPKRISVSMHQESDSRWGIYFQNP